MVMTLMSNPKGSVATIIVAADGTGDTTDIQTGINLLPATGGCVYIKEGTYTLTQAITINVDNTALVGCGRSSHIVQTAADDVIDATGRNYVHIEKLRLDGNSVATFAIVYFTATTGSKVISCWVEDSNFVGLYAFTSATNCLFKGNVITGSTQEGIRLLAATSTIVSNNFVTGNTSSGIWLTSGSTENIISNNYSSTNRVGITLRGSDSNIIDGNICYLNGRSGIMLEASSENIISNNTCSNNSTSAANTYSGIKLQTFETIHCLRNVIGDNKCSNYDSVDQMYGIEEDDANQDYNTITGNVCSGNTTAQILIQGANTAHGRNIPSEIHYWSCSGTNFHVHTETQDWRHSSGKLIVDSNDTICNTSVNLPNGAIVTGAIVYGSISDETWQLNRINLSTAATSNLAVANINTQDTGIDNATIDNNTYGYYFTTATLDSTDEIYGARITYTFVNDPS